MLNAVTRSKVSTLPVAEVKRESTKVERLSSGIAETEIKIRRNQTQINDETETPIEYSSC